MLEKVISSDASKDGNGKIVHIQAGFLGAIKQLPYLIKSLEAAMPKLHINISFGGKYVNPRQILSEDMFRLTGKRLNDLSNISIGHSNQHGYDLILVPKVTAIYTTNYCEAASNGMEFFIDPLKYEERKLLSQAEIDGLRNKYKITEEKVVVAGSVRPEEVDSICTALNYAIANCEDSKLLLVPRRNFFNIQNRLLKRNIGHCLDTKIKDENVIVITEEGILQDLYSICDAAFIGDTLWNTGRGGGQNPLEPAFYSKRIICGDNWKNNEDAYVGLRGSGLLIQVADQDELNEAMKEALSSPPAECEINAAQDFIRSRQGASEKYATFIRDILYSRN